MFMILLHGAHFRYDYLILVQLTGIRFNLQFSDLFWLIQHEIEVDFTVCIF